MRTHWILASLVVAVLTSPLSAARPALHDSAAGGDVAGVRARLQHDSVDGVDEEGKTALILASQNGRLEVVGELLGHGANVDVADAQGMTALMWGVAGDHTQVAELLLLNGADLKHQTVAGDDVFDLATLDPAVCTPDVLQAILDEVAVSNGSLAASNCVHTGCPAGQVCLNCGATMWRCQPKGSFCCQRKVCRSNQWCAACSTGFYCLPKGRQCQN